MATRAAERLSRLHIDGEWVDGSGKIEVLNPATEEVLGLAPEASAEQAEQAVHAARRAFDEGPWPRLSGRERSDILSAFADRIEAHRDEIVDLIVAETGCPRLIAGDLHFGMPLRQLRWWADQAATFQYTEPLPAVVQRGADGRPGNVGQGMIRKEPVGVVSAITAFNFPWSLGIWKLGPALAMGNTMVVKPSPYTPYDSLLQAELLAESGLPAGVVNVVTGGAEVGHIITTHDAVDMVSFTGSDTVGRNVGAQASGNLKRLVLELGGKSANIVFSGSDLSKVLPLAIFHFTAQCGQGCSLNTRLLVQRDIHDELLGMICAGAQAVKVGDPEDPTTTLGPLIREVQRERVERYVEHGKSDGATIAFGGNRPVGLDRGYFFEPTVFKDVDNGMTIAQDEIFGPVLCVIPFEDEDNAIEIANDSRYGLAASVWHPDASAAIGVAEQIRAGSISVNGGGGGNDVSPYGGYKHSGVGVELGPYGLHEFVQLKNIGYPAMGA
jgi:aldehyde dehydrogenase (NAD+)